MLISESSTTNRKYLLNIHIVNFAENLLVINTSKPLNQFLKDNEEKIKNMIMFDSSHATKNNNFFSFSNQNIKDIIKKIPVQEQTYQENGTCWANTICTNSSLLNNYDNYEQIIDVNSITQNLDGTTTFKPQEGVQDSIINETSEYFGVNTEKIKEEKDYEKITIDMYGTTLDFNIKQNQFFQEPLEVFKTKQKYLIKLENRLNELKSIKQEDIKQKQEEYKKNAEKLKQETESLLNELSKENELVQVSF